jgi:phospholipid/cholesterol/gamma-HCH transport system substrate-binding protein
LAKFRRQTETIVGVFVLGSLILLLAVVLFMGKRQNILEKRYELIGAFDSVAGLEPGAEVLLAGINVGYVKEIKFGPDNRVRVVMSITQAQRERIRRDSVVSIRTRGLVGDRYLEITTGSQKEPIIAHQGSIRASEPIDVAALLEETRPVLRHLEGLIKNMSVFSDQLTESSGSLGNFFKNINAISSNIRRGEGTVGALLMHDELYRETSNLLQASKETMDNLREVSNDMRRTSKSLPNLMTETRTSVRKLGEAAGGVSDAMVSVSMLMSTIKDVVDEAKPIASNLRSSSEQIKEIAPRIGPLLESVDEGVSEARRVIKAAERNWLIRGYLEPAALPKPLALSGRDGSPADEDKGW